MVKPKNWSLPKILRISFILLLLAPWYASAWDYRQHGRDWPDICKNGTLQSPVDLSHTTLHYPISISLYYSYHIANAVVKKQAAIPETELNTGHSIQINGDLGYFLYGRHKFEAKQFHFHQPSEHTLNGKHFPLEMHIVHQDKEGTIAVIAVFFKEGTKTNPFIEQLELGKIRTQNSHHELLSTMGLSFLDRPTSHYLYYRGSFTTPPCTEGVNWFLLTDDFEISKAQLTSWPKFNSAPTGNYRQTMPLNGRVVKKF